ncbi:MAG: GNAT family N-acetyltransferase [Gemmatimonadetes bacterium]|jgi:RimJ/RimL family protein N-acetyltransferase|nr:GNAT family N-acetyltransferase [Gemmatimonadota bacterium]MBT4609353.1 GNAT family N-acetyltransferase [Gemmatimonadota bacterium]MBT5057619.1 GNAT family N-acetyltransferase [Gemmatimonadota bacterium]MBT5142647.1 GNAT family N-acetyltransferase [Gemmatimonadota bacterium]MBT5587623.1 GNAT family N-acetyltransferase [Gemmatimonadota bacterium]
MNCDRQPHLVGEIVALRPLVEDDFDDLYRVAADPLIWEQHPATDRHERAQFEAYFREALASGGALTVLDACSKQIIGATRYHGYEEKAGEIEIGWTFLSRACWGGSYNAEMKQLMLGHAFQFVRSVVLLIGPDNLRSRRAAEKIGAICTGERTDGSGQRSLVYEVTRPGG